jgi:hypothetical protein
LRDNRASASVACAKQGVDLFRVETALLEKAHLAAAFPEIARQRRTEFFQPHLFDGFLPARGVDVQAGIDESVIDAAFAQFRADLQRSVAALET